jgi:ribosomal protein S18 acetylase RimI-like enzyme
MTEIIRKAVDADLAAVKSCAASAYNRYIDRIGKKPAPMIADFAGSIKKEELYVVEDQAKICGFVVFYAKPDHIHLENVAVSPD